MQRRKLRPKERNRLQSSHLVLIPRPVLFPRCFSFSVSVVLDTSPHLPGALLWRIWGGNITERSLRLRLGSFTQHFENNVIKIVLGICVIVCVIICVIIWLLCLTLMPATCLQEPSYWICASSNISYRWQLPAPLLPFSLYFCWPESF